MTPCGVSRSGVSLLFQLILQASDLLFQHLVMRLQLPNARFRRLQVIDANIGAPHRSGGLHPQRPALQHLPPGQIVLLDQRRGGECRRGPFAGVAGAKQRQDTVKADEVFLLNFPLLSV